jgi:hypothetical protein
VHLPGTFDTSNCLRAAPLSWWMFPTERVGVLRKDAPCNFDDRARSKPSLNQTAFPIIHIIGNAFWLDVWVGAIDARFAQA